jgi:hypothetical protein
LYYFKLQNIIGLYPDKTMTVARELVEQNVTGIETASQVASRRQHPLLRTLGRIASGVGRDIDMLRDRLVPGPYVEATKQLSADPNSDFSLLMLAEAARVRKLEPSEFTFKRHLNALERERI